MVKVLDDGSRQRFRAAWRNDQARRTVVDQATQAFHLGRDRWHALAQCQGQSSSHSGNQGRLAVDVEHGPEPRTDCGEIRHADAVGDVQRLGITVQIESILALAGNQELGIPPGRQDQLRRFEE